MSEQPCLFGWKKCSNENPCPMHPVWKNLKNCFENWACNSTLKDVQDSNLEPDFVKWYYYDKES